MEKMENGYYISTRASVKRTMGWIAEARERIAKLGIENKKCYAFPKGTLSEAIDFVEQFPKNRKARKIMEVITYHCENHEEHERFIKMVDKYVKEHLQQ